MQVFVTDRPDPVPLETDEAVKLETIHSAMKKNYLVGMWIMLGIALLQMVFQGWQLVSNPIFWFLSTQPVISVIWLPLALYTLWQLWQYRRWYRGSRAAVEAGGACLPGRIPGGRAAEWPLLAVDGTVFLLLLWSALVSDAPDTLLWGLGIGLGAMALTLGVKTLLKRLGAAAAVNRVVTIAAAFLVTFGLLGLMTWMVLHGSRNEAPEYYDIQGYRWPIYHDAIPLRVEDLTEVDYEYYSTHLICQGSPLLEKTTCRQDGVPNGEEVPELDYEIMDVRLGCLYGLCLENYMDLTLWNEGEEEICYRYEPVDPTPWQAEAVYRKQMGETWTNDYVICWEDRIVEFRSSWDLTEAQITVAAEKLSK